MANAANLATLPLNTKGMPEAKKYFAYAGQENLFAAKVTRKRNVKFTAVACTENPPSRTAQYAAKKTPATNNQSTSELRIFEIREVEKILTWK